MGPRTILVVDDAAAIRAAMRAALEHAGYAVVEAENGLAALQQAQRHLPDAVVLDLAMPLLDGWNTMRALQWDCRTHGIPVISMSAQHGVSATKLDGAGFCSHLEKPFTLARLREELDRCLGSAAPAAAPRADAGSARRRAA